MNKPHENCKNCGLKNCPFVPSELPDFLPNRKTVWIVGEAPGETEVEKGRPFVGKSGRLLRNVIKDLKFYKHFNVVITNACLCRPENNRTPTVREIKSCEWHLEKLYEQFKPDLIIAVGRIASSALGIRASISKERGNIFDSKYGKVLVTYHPSAILRDNKQTKLPLFKKDLAKAKAVLLSEDTTEEPEIVIPKTNQEMVQLFEEMERTAIEEKKFVAFDIETLPIPWDTKEAEESFKHLGLDPYNPYSGICTISFAYKNKAFAIPVWYKEKLEFIVKDQEEKYKKYFGEILSGNLYRRLVSLKKKILTEDAWDDRTLARTYKGLSLYIEPLLKYLSSPSETTKQELIKFFRELDQEVIFHPDILNTARKHLEEYDYDIDPNLAVEWIKRFLQNEEIQKIGHNLKFEFKMLYHELGVETKGLAIDTMLLAYLMDSTMQGYYSLDALTSMYLPKYENYKKEFLARSLLEYNAMDSFITLKLAKVLMEELYKRRPKWEVPHIKKALRFLVEEATPFLAKVEYNGFHLDYDKLEEFVDKVKETREKVLDKIYEITGTRDVTKKSFKNIFYGMYEHEPIMTEKGELSLKSDAIKEVYSKTQNKQLKKLCTYLLTLKKLLKIEASYLRAFKQLVNRWSGRIHPQFKLTGTATGRLSSSDPNFQNIPRSPIKICPECIAIPFGEGDLDCPVCGSTNLVELVNIKELITAPDGYLIIASDYSQMEFRVLAEFTKDRNLIKVLEEDLDIHSYNASKIFGIPYEEIKAKKNTDPKIASLRQQAKSVTFGVMYGQTAVGLANTFNIPIEEAERIISAFYRAYPNVEAWIKHVHEHVKLYHAYYTPVGRIRRFPVINGAAFREAQNFPIQSFASDITLTASIEIQRRLEKIGGYVIGLVHDSIEAVVPEDKVEEAVKIFKECMIDYVRERFNLSIPIKIDIEVGKSWGKVEEIEV